MHPALAAIRDATSGTGYEGEVWLVGGAVRDELLGRPDPDDFDLVLESPAPDLASFLYERGVSSIAPVSYPRFGTALVRVLGTKIELATARKESYASTSRKPDVEPATLLEDALRRDFTVNALLRNLHTWELADPLAKGLDDLSARILRTPRDPKATFHDDPLRMLRAVRFRWQLGLQPAEGLYESIRDESERLGIISAERIRDELVTMLVLADADRALDDLHSLGLLGVFAPELADMKGVEQGSFHHLDVWDHTLLVLRLAATRDLTLALAILFHDVGKPKTRTIDEQGNTRFFGHENVGSGIAHDVLARLKFSNEDIEPVAKLVRNHMRLGSSPEFTPAAARRLIRDLGDDLGRLLDLVDADTRGLRPGVKKLDLAPIRAQIEAVARATPRAKLESPLSGEEIMALTGLPEGPEVGRIKAGLLERVLEGDLAPDDREAARRAVEDLRG